MIGTLLAAIVGAALGLIAFVGLKELIHRWLLFFFWGCVLSVGALGAITWLRPKFSKHYIPLGTARPRYFWSHGSLLSDLREVTTVTIGVGFLGVIAYSNVHIATTRAYPWGGG
jgi:hypothetical protein